MDSKKLNQLIRRDALKKILFEALELDLEYSEKRIQLALEKMKSNGGTWRESAVLVLFSLAEKLDSQDDSPLSGCSVLFTKRSDRVETHKGQVSFPGGQCDSHELSSPEKAALRETQEEVALSSDQIEVIGGLPELFTITGFRIHPFVGVLKTTVQNARIDVNPEEIEEAGWIEVSHLMKSQTYRLEEIKVGQESYPNHIFDTGSFYIWGVTGAMTKNLLDRLRRCV